MKLSIFLISSVLTCLVAATPLVPRAPSKPFKLSPRDIAEGFKIFPALQVQPIQGTKYFRFGWFNANSHQAQLYFPNDPEYPGPVVDNRRHEYEMVLSKSTIFPGVYQVFLVSKDFDRTRRFTIFRNMFRYDDRGNGVWFSCQINSDRVDLYFGDTNHPPAVCRSIQVFELYPEYQGLGPSLDIGVRLN